MQPGVRHRLSDVETLKRQRYFFDDSLEAARLDLDRLARATSNIDGNDTVNRSFGTYRLEQPDAPCRLVQDRTGRRAHGRRHRGHAFPYRPWYRPRFRRLQATIG